MTLNITLGLMEQIGDLAKRAGNEIMKIYNTDFAVETKADSSPVTEADQIAEDLITRGIQEGLTASYPIIGAEGFAAGQVPRDRIRPILACRRTGRHQKLYSEK